MPEVPDSQAVVFSEGCYRRLLAAYPKEHRTEYGPAMVQLFRDQCRDAWREGRTWGVIRLWSRVLPDLVKTSVIEHLEGGRKLFMRGNKLSMGPLVAAVAVFVLVVTTTALVTFLLPETYASTARVNAVNLREYDSNALHIELETMRSDVVLARVVDSLDLNKKWGRQYAGGIELKTSESLALLKQRLDLRPVRNSALIEIRAYSETPADAANFANAVAESYLQYSHEQAGLKKDAREIADGRVQIMDRATASSRPARPNVPLNICIGVLLGGIAGGVAAGLVMLLRKWLGPRGGQGSGRELPPVIPPAEIRARR